MVEGVSLSLDFVAKAPPSVIRVEVEDIDWPVAVLVSTPHGAEAPHEAITDDEEQQTKQRNTGPDAKQIEDTCRVRRRWIRLGGL